MTVFVFGLNHKTAPVSIREKVSVNPEQVEKTLNHLINFEGIEEALVLSTCNRTEVYCCHTAERAEDIIRWLYEFFGLEPVELQSYLFSYTEEQAVRHLMRVASGLDSMVLGEPQILGQIKSAYREAHQAKTVGKILNRLFQHSFTVGKQVRTDTTIGASPVSVAFAAVRLAQQVFGDLEHQTALLIGAGDTIELAAQHLHENKLGRMIVANRSMERAQTLASRFNGFGIQLKDLPDHLAEADIVLSSTASQLPILGKGAVERALKDRKRKPMFMVDIAVPRDIEPEIGKLNDIYLYTVDDLQAVIEENRQSRNIAALQADEIVLTETRHFMDWMQSLDAHSTIQAIREELRTAEQSLVDKAKQHLAKGEDPGQVVEALARALGQKFTHQPSVKLKQAGKEKRHEMIKAARDLFDL